MRTHHRLLLGLASVALTASVAACGGSSDNASPAAPATSAAPTSAAPSAAASSAAPSAAAGGTLTVATTPLGKLLADGQGYVLYVFDKDTATTSACVGPCAVNWPPVAAPVTAAAGVTLPGSITAITRPDGSSQAAYDGHPLYHWIKDTAPGQTTGNGVQGVWHVVTIS
jgi:predicted lipoprotein with Yx(FWY)xxD motif